MIIDDPGKIDDGQRICLVDCDESIILQRTGLGDNGVEADNWSKGSLQNLLYSITCVWKNDALFNHKTGKKIWKEIGEYIER